MPLPPSTGNYLVAGARLVLGGLDFGNIVNLEIEPDVETLPHFTARSGVRRKDHEVVVQKGLRFTAELDEHQRDLYARFLMGGGGATTVFPLTSPLLETNVLLEVRDQTGIRFSYSHTRAIARPSGPIDLQESEEWGTYEMEVEALEDTATPSTPFGILTFT